MPANLAVAAPAPAPKTVQRGGEQPQSPSQDGDSFADAMQAQAPAEAPQATAQSPEAAATSAAPRERAPAPADTAAAPETDATLDPQRVEALLGLCDSPQDAGAAAPTPGDSTTSAGTSSAAGIEMPQLCLPPVAPPAPLSESAGATTDAAAVDGSRVLLEVGERRLADAAGPGSMDGMLAARLEAALSDKNDGDPASDAQPLSATTSAASEARAQARSADVAGSARTPELRAPLGTPAWADELGTRVSWMVDQGEQVASLRLNPENLGPLDVRIAVREGETTVWFGAANAETRAALEQSLPRLREMLGASGLALANAGVFSQTPRDPQRGFTAAALARAAAEAGGDAAVVSVNGVTQRGLVDLYA